MLRLLLASAVTCAVLTPAFAEEAAPVTQVVIVPGESVEPAQLPQSVVIDEAAVSVPEDAKAQGPAGHGCHRGSTVYLTN